MITITSVANDVTGYGYSTWPGTATEYFITNYITNGSVQGSNYQYNTFGHPTQAVDPIGRTFSYSYASNNIDLQEIRETRGTDNFLIGHWDYNSQHRPTDYIDGSAQQTSYGYNSSGELTSITDPNSNVTKLTYTGTCIATIGGTKTTGDVLTITAHDTGLTGGQQAVSYTVLSGDTLSTIAAGLAAAVNANSNLQAIGVSATSNSTVITLTSTSVNVTTYTESTSGGATETITLGINIFGYLTKIDGPLTGSNDITTFAYDAVRLSQRTDSEGYAVNFAYDNADRLTKTTYPDATTEQIVYDKLDAALRKDRIGRWTQDCFDALDQLSYEIDPLGRKTQYTWCVCGSLATLTDPAGKVTTWSHDLEGRVIGKTYADQTSVSYVLDSFVGRLQSKTDALNQTTNYTYCQDNTPYQVSYANAVNPTSTVTYSFDPNFKRITNIVNGWGAISYTYNAYVTNAHGTPTTGGGMLQKVHNNVIANSDITYSYDALGRTTNRSINSTSNSITWSYDAMSRITSEANALGTFGYSYVDDVSGSSKGTLRLSSISYPNGQVTNFGWYGNTGDQRLQSINNLLPSGAPLSQFSYGYDSAGEILHWGQQSANLSPRVQNLGYDLAGQLTSSQSGFGAAPPKYADQFNYAYDCAANRTAVQTSLTQTANITGTVTSSNTLTITVNDPALSGGTEAVTYTVQSGDTLSSIATNLAAAITADTNLQAIGVNAVASSTQISLRSTSANLTTYSQSTSGGATESIALGISANAVQNATIGGTVTSGNVLTLTAYDAGLTGGSAYVTYTATGGDTLNTLATHLASAVNGSSALSAAGITATATQNIVHIKSTSANLTTYSQSVTSGGTETIYLALNMNGPQTVLVGGSKTTGDVLGITVFDSTLGGGSEPVSYTVESSDTLPSIATALTSAINSDTNLQNIGVSATSSGTLITISSISTGVTGYVVSRPTTATETLVAGINPNGVQTAAIGGTKSTGDTVTITVYDSGISGGSKPETYTVLSGDTLTSIAAGLAGVINGDSTLSALGISATSASTVVNVKSTSNNLTTYAKSTGTGATETVTLAQGTGITGYSYNDLNELTSTSGGGAARFLGTTNKPIKSATINSTVAATLPNSTGFTANAALSTGSNASTVNAVDGNNNSVTNTYQVSVKGGPSATLTNDANGNMTSDGTNSYAWDAENRMIKITYPGTNNYSTFVYDGLSRNATIVETVGGSVTSTKQFVWCGNDRCEARDGSGNLLAQFFGRGETISSTKYLYTTDHLGSVREMTDNSGNIQAQYTFDPFGRVDKITEVVPSDFGYAGYYVHARSGLDLTYTGPTVVHWQDLLAGILSVRMVDSICTAMSAVTPSATPILLAC